MARRKSQHTRMHAAYKHAKSRCEDPEDNQYHNYGGRGIKFLFKSFEEFVECTEGPYGPTLSIDRKDNNGHYECGNTRWATDKEQGSNRRNNVRITHNGVTKTIAEWARHFDIQYNAFHRMINGKQSAESIIRRLEFNANLALKHSGSR